LPPSFIVFESPFVYCPATARRNRKVFKFWQCHLPKETFPLCRSQLMGEGSADDDIAPTAVPVGVRVGLEGENVVCESTDAFFAIGIGVEAAMDFIKCALPEGKRIGARDGGVVEHDARSWRGYVLTEEKFGAPGHGVEVLPPVVEAEGEEGEAGEGSEEAEAGEGLEGFAVSDAGAAAGFDVTAAFGAAGGDLGEAGEIVVAVCAEAVVVDAAAAFAVAPGD